MSTSRSPSRDATHAFGFRDPSTSDQKTIDYYPFMAEAIIDAQECFRRILREDTGGRWLIMHYLGYLCELSDAPFQANYGGQTACARRSLGSPTLDAAAGTYSCCFRGEGQPAGYHTTQHSWALDYIEYALEQNVVAGYEDGLYHPDDIVTRDQMAVYVARAFELTG